LLPLADSATDPNVVEPSDRNTTVPDGAVLPDEGLTVAVKVVVPFEATVDGLAVTAVVVPTLDVITPDHPVTSASTSNEPSPVTRSYPTPAR
jgi:hypothetical protein